MPATRPLDRSSTAQEPKRGVLGVSLPHPLKEGDRLSAVEHRLSADPLRDLIAAMHIKEPISFGKGRDAV